ncbi:MAG TPA: hypothetical protein VMS96_00435 [Terriglobales bacterium]|nr:hypothetical protein [Terriglobales bacterium]
MKRLLVLVIAVALVAFYAGTLSVSAEGQPHMRAALRHLEAAKAELEKAEADKGGHREAALKATNDAIGHVKEGMEYAEKHHH